MLKSSKEIERSVIGMMMAFPEEDYSKLESQDFYEPSYAILFESMSKLKEGGGYDVVTLKEYLDSNKGGIFTSAELADIMTCEYTSAFIDSYIRKLKDYRRLRELQRIGDLLYNLKDAPQNLAIEYANKINEISTIGADDESTVDESDVTRTKELVQSRFDKDLYGYSWGEEFGFLNDVTKGLVKKRVYRVGAPSNTGKTQLVYNIIPSLLKQKNPDGSDVKIAFFTLENAKEDTLISIMCAHSGIDSKLLNRGHINGNWDYLSSLKDRLYVIDDVYDLDKIFSKVVAIKPDIVILDYITHVTIKGNSGLEKYDTYAERVPKFVKSRDLVWIDLSNLPKNLQLDDEIRLSPGFYGSSILFNNCDVAIHLMRNPVFKKTKHAVLGNPSSTDDNKWYFKNRNCLDLVITKNRWGSVFVEQTYGMNFENGGKWKALEASDLEALSFKYS